MWRRVTGSLMPDVSRHCDGTIYKGKIINITLGIGQEFLIQVTLRRGKTGDLISIPLCKPEYLCVDTAVHLFKVKIIRVG
jgi:hypothetical protein